MSFDRQNHSKRLIPLPLKELLVGVRQVCQRFQYKRKLKRTSIIVPGEGIFLNLGKIIPEGTDAVITGGKVKLLHLKECFPEKPNRFNLLYLVSSAQPLFSVELVRWAKDHGARFVWNQNGVAYPAWAGFSYQNTNEPMKTLIRLADYIIYQSEFCRQSADRYLGKTDTACEIVYNCVDTSYFKPRLNPLSNEPWILLMAGSHQQAERVISALETVAFLKKRGRQVRLILAGRLDWPGAETQTLSVIKDRGLEKEVEIYPPFTQAQAPALYQRAHILLHPKYKDPCPTVPLEAMACGLPVVGSNSGGMPELIGNDGGILIDVPESWDHMFYPKEEEMAEAVIRIFQDLEKWRHKAIERVREKFDKNKWLDRHREIFQKVLVYQ